MRWRAKLPSSRWYAGWLAFASRHRSPGHRVGWAGRSRRDPARAGQPNGNDRESLSRSSGRSGSWEREGSHPPQISTARRRLAVVDRSATVPVAVLALDGARSMGDEERCRRRARPPRRRRRWPASRRTSAGGPSPCRARTLRAGRHRPGVVARKSAMAAPVPRMRTLDPREEEGGADGEEQHGGDGQLPGGETRSCRGDASQSATGRLSMTRATKSGLGSMDGAAVHPGASNSCSLRNATRSDSRGPDRRPGRRRAGCAPRRSARRQRRDPATASRESR